MVISGNLSVPNIFAQLPKVTHSLRSTSLHYYFYAQKSSVTYDIHTNTQVCKMFGFHKRLCERQVDLEEVPVSTWPNFISSNHSATANNFPLDIFIIIFFLSQSWGVVCTLAADRAIQNNIYLPSIVSSHAQFKLLLLQGSQFNLFLLYITMVLKWAQWSL